MAQAASFIVSNIGRAIQKLEEMRGKIKEWYQNQKKLALEALETLGIKHEKAIQILKTNSNITIEKKKIGQKEYFYLRFFDKNGVRRSIYAGTEEKARDIIKVKQEFEEKRARFREKMRTLKELERKIENFAELLSDILGGEIIG